MNDASDDQKKSGLTPTHGVWMVVGSAALGLVVLGVIFRRPSARD